MATFGQTSNNANTQTFSADRIYLSTATPATSGTVTAGKGRNWVSAAASPGCRIVIYSDSGGSPDTLLATSDEVIISNTTEQENTFAFSGAEQISIVGGTPYWFGFMFDDPGTPNMVMSRANNANVVHFGSVTYPSAPSTFTSSGTASGAHDVYIEYTEAATSAIKTFQGLAYASTKTVEGLAIASVKNKQGLA